LSVIYLISAIFLWKEIAESCWTQSEQVRNRPFKKVVWMISAIFH